MQKRDVKCEIVKEIGVITNNDTSGWRKEVNLVSWNDNPAKIDIRDWSPDHEKAGKGLVLTEEEAKSLAKILTKELK